MKVLHILGELKYSGAEIMMNAAKEKFLAHGIKTTILSTGVSIGEYSDELKKSLYEVKHIPFGKNLAFCKEIFALFRAEKYDVIHIHTERFFFFYILLAYVAGTKKIVRTIHSVFKFYGFLAWRRRLFIKMGKALGCEYIVISKTVKENERKVSGIEPVLINNWIDLDLFSPGDKAKELNSNCFKLISVGSCTNVKQHALILRLVSHLIKLGHCVEYLHLGCGELEAKEKELCNSLSISSSVSFMGNQKNVVNFLRESDFFLMPSAYEGLGNACLESMSVGLVSIVNNVPGLNDLIEDGVDGFLVNFGDTEAVATQLINLKNDHGVRELIRRNAREKIQQHYSIANVDKQIELYLCN